MSMGLNNLQNNLNALHLLEHSNKSLAVKLAIAEETQAHEKSVEFLLRFELAQLRAHIAEARRDVDDLEREQRRLIASNQELTLQVKLIRNYFGYVNGIQVRRKESWLQDLRNTANSLDFALEARQLDPNGSMDAFTQIPR